MADINHIKGWDPKHVEILNACPVCGGKGQLTYSGLTDIVFACAPGAFSVWRCEACGSGYLDPRPDRETIGQAYTRYYTHGEATDGGQQAVFGGNAVLQMAVNGRLNRRYGLDRQPASAALGLMLDALPFINHYFDLWGRSLHKPEHPGATLLDYGCGDGRFLGFAREMGYTVKGVDVDEKAVMTARAAGLDVALGDFSALDADERFDVITLSHVIEHVHDPLDLLRQCFQHLKPGGRVVIETPNFDALGRDRFGAKWLGLDCPRHLAIFTERSLAGALTQTGFTAVRCTSRHFLTLAMYADSRILSEGRAYSDRAGRRLFDVAALKDGVRALFDRSRVECIRFEATRP